MSAGPGDSASGSEVKGQGVIRYGGQEMPVGDVGFEIELDSGSYEDIANGRPFHSLSLWADPENDGIPRLVMTDVDLYAAGAPDALDGLRLRVDTESGDFDEAPDVWIRPGSLVGMAEVVFEPHSAEDSGDWDPNARRSLAGVLELRIDRQGAEWRIRVSTGVEGDRPSDDPDSMFYADFVAPLALLGLRGDAD
ncbi:MAG: hypothetical protein ACF8R9_14845 [Phycisphaerales bacterium JB054]